jgi:hypothetical protein
MLTASILLLFKGGDKVGKFGGLGLKNMLICALFTMVVIVILKTIVIKHPIAGVTELVNAV